MRSGGAIRAVALAWLGLAAVGFGSPAPRAASPRVWIERGDTLGDGRADGMALTRDGRLFRVPRPRPLGGARMPAGPVQVWSMVARGDGTFYLGTGPEGQILEIDATGRSRAFAALDEPLVTALAIGPGGALLAASAPGGAIHRFDRDGAGEIWAVTDERYVWSLAVGPAGEVYAGTGERGRILRIGRDGAVRVLFDSDESHVVSLETLPDGGLLAGGAGRGLVYRIDAEGHALVLHDDDLAEVTAVAADGRGGVVAALVGAPPSPERRPVLRLRLPDGVRVGSADEALGTLEESAGPTLHGTIEGLEAGGAAGPGRRRGRLLRIDAGGRTTELWASDVESPFCLARDAAGRLWFGTGEPARAYRVEPDGDLALMATLREAQLTGLLAAGDSVVLATSNPAAAYRWVEDPGAAGSYVSRAFDAGGPARWGSIRWHVGEPSGRTELYTRTGNTREPDPTWSAWSPALTDPAGGEVVNPDGRFLQWRVRRLGGDERTRVERVAVHYEPYNRPPRFERFRREGAALAWTVGDADGDPLVVRVEYRPQAGGAWRTALDAAIEATGTVAADARVGRGAWDTTSIAEGAYELRAVVSDRPANPPGEGHDVPFTTTLPWVVDRSPPRIEIRTLEGGALRVLVEDDLSAIRRLEVRSEGQTRFRGRADDGVCDSRAETFLVELPAGAGSGWSLRGEDAAGNAVEQAVPAIPGGI